VTFLKQLLQDDRGSTDVQNRLIAALFNLGMAQGDPESLNLGHYGEARKTFEEVLALSEAAYSRRPAAEPLLNICHALNYLGKNHRHQGRLAEARRCFRSSIDRLEQFLAANPAAPLDTRLVLAFSHSLHALTAAGERDPAVFSASISRALALREPLLARVTGWDVFRHRRGISITLGHAAEGALLLQQHEQAAAFAARGVALEREDLRREDHPNTRLYLALHLRFTAQAAHALGQPAAASAAASESVRHLEHLVRNEPFSGRFDQALAEARATFQRVTAPARPEPSPSASRP
jgi:tetratricopeptide (TPR) repeat protein